MNKDESLVSSIINDDSSFAKNKSISTALETSSMQKKNEEKKSPNVSFEDSYIRYHVLTCSFQGEDERQFFSVLSTVLERM